MPEMRLKYIASEPTLEQVIPFRTAAHWLLMLYRDGQVPAHHCDSVRKVLEEITVPEDLPIEARKAVEAEQAAVRG